jgi:hypothetical protein
MAAFGQKLPRHPPYCGVRSAPETSLGNRASAVPMLALRLRPARPLLDIARCAFDPPLALPENSGRHQATAKSPHRREPVVADAPFLAGVVAEQPHRRQKE